MSPPPLEKRMEGGSEALLLSLTAMAYSPYTLPLVAAELLTVCSTLPKAGEDCERALSNSREATHNARHANNSEWEWETRMIGCAGLRARGYPAMAE